MPRSVIISVRIGALVAALGASLSFLTPASAAGSPYTSGLLDIAPGSVTAATSCPGTRCTGTIDRAQRCKGGGDGTVCVKVDSGCRTDLC